MMALESSEVEALCAKIDLKRDGQQKAVAAALRKLLVEGRRGIVLADEVGFGKTYEALAIMALLAERAREARKSFDRVLILCKSSLLDKWQEELAHGFPKYLTDENWPARHPLRKLMAKKTRINQRASGEDLLGIRDGGKLQTPTGIYVVNEQVLSKKSMTAQPRFRRLYTADWDLIIVDEAHHYACKNIPAQIFAPDECLENYDQGISGGRFGKILALTATPFELKAQEMVQLLALVRAEPSERELVRKGLELYENGLDQFFKLRGRSPADGLRKEAVARLHKLRESCALGTGDGGCGLQELMRRYIVRNMKSENERRYSLVNKTSEGYALHPFDKMRDIQQEIKKQPLLPFEGADALFYFELRELIQETIDKARDGDERRTFVTTDLRQGLSSYPQIEQSALLDKRLESAMRLKKLLRAWTGRRKQRLHPKVRALADVVAHLAESEIARVRSDPSKWFAKVLVFNKLISGTAPHLVDVLTRRIQPIFRAFLEECLASCGAGAREEYARRVRKMLESAMSTMKRSMSERFGDACKVPHEFTSDNFANRRGHHLVDVYRNTILRRTEQELFLLRCLLKGGTEDAAIQQWVEHEVAHPFERWIVEIVEKYLVPQTDEAESIESMEWAERDCIFALQEQSSVRIIGRFDGKNAHDREAHRRNFNNRFNPFVLLVSRVGEEGIDLQKECKYIIHYDLEWNPAKMEQREGRVDRDGWNREKEHEYIDVRFMLLKGTYEERIFHTVMKRDQWFQILIGSKRKELGRPDTDEDAEAAHDLEEGDVVVEDWSGTLTNEEKQAVMIDLRP
jgi:superfamily II DNA or RNA helicase